MLINLNVFMICDDIKIGIQIITLISFTASRLILRHEMKTQNVKASFGKIQKYNTYATHAKYTINLHLLVYL